jgi:hypothetical protein
VAAHIVFRWDELSERSGVWPARRGLQGVKTEAEGEGWRVCDGVAAGRAVLPQLVSESAEGETGALAKMAGWTRLELATSGVTGRKRLL